MPNMATTRLIKAANHPLTWEYRHDLALADGLPLPQVPHPFLALFIGISAGVRWSFRALPGSYRVSGAGTGGRILRFRWADRAGSEYAAAIVDADGVV